MDFCKLFRALICASFRLDALFRAVDRALLALLLVDPIRGRLQKAPAAHG